MTRNKLYSSILLLLLVPFALQAQVDITRDAPFLMKRDGTLHTSFVCVTSFVLCENSPERLQTRPARSFAKLRNRTYK